MNAGILIEILGLIFSYTTTKLVEMFLISFFRLFLLFDHDLFYKFGETLFWIVLVLLNY